MKRYLVFGGTNYYPEGGWDDFFGSADSMLEAVTMVAKEMIGDEWWQIVDTTTGEIVDRGSREY